MEVVWVSICLLFALLVVFPIWSAGIPFEWIEYNIVFLFLALSIIRLLFFFEHHPFYASRAFKIMLICIVPLSIFPIIEGIHSFTEFHDREGLQSILGAVPPDKQSFYIQYIRTEYLLAGITCFLGVFALIIKMIRSLWRQVKYNVV